MGITAILQLVAALVPVANSLISTLAAIKNQTEADHPEVWAKIRDDWKDTAAKWAALVEE